MVHILDAKVTRRYGEYFIRNINKFEEIIRDVSGRWAGRNQENNILKKK